jgi:hypothetical protein
MWCICSIRSRSGGAPLARGLGRAATAHLDSTYLSSEVVRTVVVETLTAPVTAAWAAGAPEGGWVGGGLLD